MSVALMRFGRVGMGTPWGGIDPGFPNPSGGDPIGDDWPDYPSATGPSSTQVLIGGSINKGLDILGDIFGNPYSRQAAYRSQTPIQTQATSTVRTAPPGYYYDQYGRLVPLEGGGGIGAGLERFIRENSTILLVGAGLLVLIQMPGFTRRGR